MDFSQFWLSDTSQMAQFIRAHDWSDTRLGPHSLWPQCLKTSVGIMLTTRHPVCIAWGPELVCLYNDGFAALLGPEKHPSVFGMTAVEAWPESHPMVAAEFEHIMNGGGATWQENRLIPMLRHGRIEETYWTYSRGPIPDATAPTGVGGVMTIITETTSTVESHKEREARLKLTLAAGRMAVWDADLVAGTVEPSADLNRLLGYPEDFQPSLDDIRSRYYANDRAKLLGMIEATREPADQFVEAEYRYTKPDGTVRWLMARVRIDHDQEGHPIRSFGVLMDVTDRKSTEQYLALEYEVTRIISTSQQIEDARNDILKLLCDHVGAVCAEWWEVGTTQSDLTCKAFFDGAGCTKPFADLTWSKSFAPGIGLPGRVLESRAPLWIDDVRVDPHFPRASAAVTVGLRSAIGFPLVSGNDCTGVVAFFSTAPILRDSAKLDLFAALGRKIGGLIRRSRAEAESRRNEILKQAILDVSLDAIITINDESIVVEWNGAATTIFGFSSEEALGRSLAELIVPIEMRQKHLDGMARYLSTGYGHVIGKRVELDAMRANGCRFPVELAINPIYIEGKTYFTAFVRDITERKRSEDNVRILVKEVNHRSKNMLAVVQAVARQTALHDDPRVFAEKFQQRLHGLAASHDLLVHNSWQGIGIGELVKAQLSHLAGLIGKRIHYDGPSIHVNATAAQSLGMALHELSTNAVKYGALANAVGSVEIKWDVDSEASPHTFHILWREYEGPVIEAPARTGFGTRLLSDMVATTTQGDVKLDYAPCGLQWSLTCPIDSIVEGDDKAANKAY